MLLHRLVSDHPRSSLAAVGSHSSVSNSFNGRGIRPVAARTWFRVSIRSARLCKVYAFSALHPGTPILTNSRCKSCAATRVNVTGRMRSGATPDSRRRATRRFIAYDLPVPGPATTRTRGFTVEAILCAGAPASIHQTKPFSSPKYKPHHSPPLSRDEKGFVHCAQSLVCNVGHPSCPSSPFMASVSNKSFALQKRKKANPKVRPFCLTIK